MATLPDGDGVDKPEFFLVLDIKYNFQQKEIVNWAQASYFGREKNLFQCWESLYFIQVLEGKQGLYLGKYFCYKISIKILTRSYQYAM